MLVTKRTEKSVFKVKNFLLDNFKSVFYFGVKKKKKSVKSAFSAPHDQPVFRNQANFSHVRKNTLTLTRPIGLPPYTLVAQKIADQR